MSTIADIFANYYQYFLRGTRTTIVVSLVTVFFGALIGCLIALLRLSKYKPLSGFAKLYITVIRGTPLLVQLYIVYYQLNFIHYPSGSFLGVELARVIPCIIALSINSGAYVAEVIRAGIQAVDYGQTEAALSCGLDSPEEPQPASTQLPANAAHNRIERNFFIAFLFGMCRRAQKIHKGRQPHTAAPD